MLHKCDILIELVEPLHAEHSVRASTKLTAEQNLDYRIRHTVGVRWQDVLKQVLCRSFSSLQSLSNMGLLTQSHADQLDGDTIAEQIGLADMIADLGLRLVAERGRS
jgi:hypothetical protein